MIFGKKGLSESYSYEQRCSLTYTPADKVTTIENDYKNCFHLYQLKQNYAYPALQMNDELELESKTCEFRLAHVPDTTVIEPFEDEQIFLHTWTTCFLE